MNDHKEERASRRALLGQAGVIVAFAGVVAAALHSDRGQRAFQADPDGIAISSLFSIPAANPAPEIAGAPADASDPHALGTLEIWIENTGTATRRDLGVLLTTQEISPATTAHEPWWVRASSDDLLHSLRFSIQVRATLGEIRFGVPELQPGDWIRLTNWFGVRPIVQVQVDDRNGRIYREV